MGFLSAGGSDFTSSINDADAITSVTAPRGLGNQHYRLRSLGSKNGSYDEK
jgi:hypothetical protein